MIKEKGVNPLVSVVIPCYNHDQFVQEAIQSVIDQDYRNIEFIIIDDGSSDDSVKKIMEMVPACEERFERFEFRHRPNKGLCATLNEAIEWCEGEYFSAIASDDILLKEKIEVQVKYMAEHPECGALFGGALIINSKGELVREINTKVGSYEFEDIFLFRKTLIAPTQIIRIALIKRAGGYKEDVYIEDRYMWLRLASLGAVFDDIGIPLVKYRRHETNISHNYATMSKSRLDIINMYSEHPMYKRALAEAYVSSALDIQFYDKVKSLRYVILSIRKSGHVLLSRRLHRYFIKLIIPRSLYIFLKRQAI